MLLTFNQNQKLRTSVTSMSKHQTLLPKKVESKLTKCEYEASAYRKKEKERKLLLGIQQKAACPTRTVDRDGT